MRVCIRCEVVGEVWLACFNARTLMCNPQVIISPVLRVRSYTGCACYKTRTLMRGGSCEINFKQCVRGDLANTPLLLLLLLREESIAAHLISRWTLLDYAQGETCILYVHAKQNDIAVNSRALIPSIALTLRWAVLCKCYGALKTRSRGALTMRTTTS
jgi:hypothetical protein